MNDSPDMQALRERVRAFAQAEVAPRADHYDVTGTFHYEIYRAMIAAELYAPAFPREVGGTDGSTASLAITMEELARADVSTAVTYATCVELAGGAILFGGTQEQKHRWIPRIIKGDLIAAFGVAESQSGSDINAIRTVALPDGGGGWVLNGEKKYVTNLIKGLPGVMVVAARVGEATKDSPLVTFLVPFETPGLQITRPYEKMAWRGTETADATLKDCSLPGDALIGETPEQGIRALGPTIDLGRIGMAAIALGSARACLEASVRYAQERVQFGRPIGDFQAIRAKLAEMRTRVEAARLMLGEAVRRRDLGEDFAMQAHMAKLFNSEVSQYVADQAVQIHGARGLTNESPVSRFYRDQRMCQIGQGTTEIEHIVIAKMLFKKFSANGGRI